MAFFLLLTPDISDEVLMPTTSDALEDESFNVLFGVGIPWYELDFWGLRWDCHFPFVLK